MVIWHGELRIAPGKREEYIAEINKADFVKKFTAQPGSVFYNIGASVTDADVLYVFDAWEDKDAFIAHDTSKEVDLWREIYSKYVVDCKSELYEF